jgi:Ulp1 protease family, C-terminal catalytic domain
VHDRSCLQGTSGAVTSQSVVCLHMLPFSTAQGQDYGPSGLCLEALAHTVIAIQFMASALLCALLCSMVDNAAYYKEGRARRVCEILYAWLLLEAHDKGAVSRILGASAANMPARPERSHVMHNGVTNNVPSALEPGSDCADAATDALTGAMSRMGLNQEESDEEEATQEQEWELEVVQDLPRQQDGHSCGVFMLAFADAILHGLKPASFPEQDVTVMRLGVAITLLRAATRK